MIRPPQEINVLLNLLSSFKKDLYPMFPWHYSRYFTRNAVPIEKTIRNNKGDISIVFINRHVAINYLKDMYGFMTSKEAEKEIKDAARDHVR